MIRFVSPACIVPCLSYARLSQPAERIGYSATLIVSEIKEGFLDEGSVKNGAALDLSA